MEILNSLTTSYQSIATQQATQSVAIQEPKGEISQKKINLNETSSLYFEPKEDISKYQISKEAQEIQNQIDEDVLNVYKKYNVKKDNDWNNYFRMNADLNYGISDITMFISLEQIDKNMAEMDRRLREWTPAQLEEAAKAPSKIYYSNDFKVLTEQDEVNQSIERFKNVYRFSDEFAQSDKFKEMHSDWNSQVHTIVDNGTAKGDDAMISLFRSSLNEMEKNKILSKGYSKSDWIEHFDRYKSELQKLIDKTKDGTVEYYNGTQERIEDNIKYYDNVTKDLKELWGYGSFDVYS